jgi:hypothetical protein
MVDGQTKQKDTSQGSGFFTKEQVPFMMDPPETMSISKSCTCPELSTITAEND